MAEEGQLDVPTYYARRLAEYGETVHALDWSGEVSQEARFRVLARALPQPMSYGVRLLDVGCGLGDLYRWLQSVGLAHVTYVGMDVTPEMCEAAARRNPGAQFHCADVLSAPWGEGEFDFVFASGLFGEVQSLHVAIDMVDAMWKWTRRALAFNMLTTVPPNCGQRNFPSPWMAHLAEGLEPAYWVLYHDYMPHDATLVLYREKPSA